MHCDVIHNFLSTIAALKREERLPKDYGTGDVLYDSEIRMLDMVSRYPDANAIQLAKQLGVTRGAVTQMSNKLEERGYLLRFLQPENRKAKFYKLTGLGQAIKKGHDRYHEDANRQICNYLKALKKTEVQIIMEFLERIRQLPISEFECNEECHCKDTIKE